jgi:GntR family transcriptional regulator
MPLFHWDPHSGIPAHVQLREEVKVALALGTLRPGELLPSIRKVEEELGVGRMLVRKAYQQLQAAGLLRIVHGKGAVLTWSNRVSNGHRTQKAEALAEKFLTVLRREGIDPVSFSRLFQQRVVSTDHSAPAVVYVDSSEILAHEIGAQVQRALGLQVRTLSLAQLKAQRRSIAPDVNVLVNFYYLEDVRKVLGRRARHVFPVSWDWASPFIDRLRALPAGSRILFLIYGERPGHEATRLVIDELIARLRDRGFRSEVRAIEHIDRPESLLRARYKAILVSNQLWGRHQALFEQHPTKFWRLATRLDEPSLQAVADRIGLVL